LEIKKQQLRNLLEQYQAGKLDEAENLATSITQKYPDHPFSWKVLGAILKQTGRITDALTTMRKSVQLAPQDDEAHNNLGATLQELGKFEEAELSYMEAIALNPHYAEAHSNLGVTLKELGRLEQALASFTKALVLKPNFAEVHNSLGVTLKKMGRLEEAKASHAKAIDLKPDYAGAMLYLSTAHGYMNDLEAEMISLQKILQIDSNNYGLRAGVNLAICNFLKGDFDESKKQVTVAKKIQDKTLSEFKNGKVYQGYLLNLLKWHEHKYLSNEKGKIYQTLHVIGESHSLASHYLRIKYSQINFFCKANLIKGCKQWHLGNSFRNEFKHQFENIFLSLPKYSYVLLAIGEIDCRLDSGIIEYKNKFPDRQIKQIILSTIEDYFAYITNKNFTHQHKIIIQGVPCPNIDARNHTQKDIKQLVEVIKVFNCELEAKSKKKGFGFLDVYKLTNKGDGLSNKFWHIDSIHLSPDGMLEAWRLYNY
jgi:Flp pilus assembly protein TadD